ncbi:alpha/beta hydrolase [Frondihabitans cladoniiphilus]|uniref:DUF1023 domain-containing protein n=1 Tax=Frondihabitans cladoniiphilus TaxID=715785 RepID=A0ABP8W3W1_9MICO
MRSWTDDEPGRGDVWPLHDSAAVLARQIEHAADMTVLLRSAATGAESFWSGDGHDAWAASLQRSSGAWRGLHGFAQATRDAVTRYAESLESIKERAARIEGRIEKAEEGFALTSGGAGSFGPGIPLLGLGGPSPQALEHRAAADQARRELQRLAEERRGVEARFLADLREAHDFRVSGGSTTGTPSAEQWAGMHGAGLLNGLSALTASQLADLLASDPTVGQRLHDLDPAVVAAWWAALDGPAPAAGGRRQPSPEQQALIDGMPEVIGTLDGVAFWARDRANHVTLAREITRLEATPGVDAEKLAALRAVRKALGAGMDGTPPQELVTLSIEGKPMAAISVGDLDVATHVSYIVPGMGTTVAGNMSAYSRASKDFFDLEAQVGHVPRSELAVIAWLDYNAPGATEVGAVKEDFKAAAGGARLGRSLEGLRSVRSASGRPADVTVIGHSYGSNVAAFALRESSVDHAVFLGSAGITDTVPTAMDLAVPRGEVFASQGHHDGWAPIGQGTSGRQDPTAGSFRAHAFSSEEGVDDDGKPLAGIDAHGPLGSRSAEGRHSYLDPGTTAQYNTAKIALGQGASIEVDGTPVDRLLLQSQDRLRDVADPWLR